MYAGSALIGMVIGIILTVIIIRLVTKNNSLDKGVAILIPAQPVENGFQKYFPDLIGDRVRVLVRKKGAQGFDYKSACTDFESHLKQKLGDPKCITADLSILVRDRTKSPAFLPVDVGILEELLTIYKSQEIPEHEKDILAGKIRGKLQNTPDLHERTTIHSVEKGRKKYHYFPRIQFEFSSKLQTSSYLDTIAYLGMAVVIKNDIKGRFIDFQPKAADIVEFTRGQLMQENQLQAKASPTVESSISDKGINSTELESAASGKSSSSAESQDIRNIKLSPEFTFTMSETFLNDLKESIEARTTGILGQGRIFYADFRSIAEKRIGGTYSFDVMMEIPSDIVDYDEVGVCSSEPQSSEIVADVYLIAVVKHVAKRGFTGWLTRVPEPSNDTVYLQVITKKESDVKLWTFGGVSWIGKLWLNDFTIKVVTNHNDASFVVENVDQKIILEQGSGNMATIKLSDIHEDTNVQVKFLDIVMFDQGKSFVLQAAPSSIFVVEADKNGEKTIVGNYNPA